MTTPMPPANNPSLRTLREARQKSAVLTKEDVSVKPITNHADTLTAAAVLLDNVVDHQGTWLANKCRFLASAALDRARHGTIACPFLSVGQMGHSIKIGGNKLATGIFIDAKLRVLNLVVVDVAVKTYNDCPNIPFIQHVEVNAGSNNRINRIFICTCCLNV